MQTLENWLSHACLYINSLSIKTIRPAEKLFVLLLTINLPFDDAVLEVAVDCQLEQKCIKERFFLLDVICLHAVG